MIGTDEDSNITHGSTSKSDYLQLGMRIYYTTLNMYQCLISVTLEYGCFRSIASVWRTIRLRIATRVWFRCIEAQIFESPELAKNGARCMIMK